MNKPTDEQVKEFWEKCGCIIEPCLHNGEKASTIIFPDARHLTLYEITKSIDLNNLFKYAVPKLRISGGYPYLTEIILDPTMCDDEIYYCYLRYDSLHDDGFVEREESQSSDKDPAQALKKAIWEVINATSTEANTETKAKEKTNPAG